MSWGVISMYKPLPVANSLLSLPTIYTSKTATPLPFLSIPPKSIKLDLSFSLEKKTHFPTLVRYKEEDSTLVLEQKQGQIEEEFSWESQELDGAEVRLSDWEGENGVVEAVGDAGESGDEDGLVEAEAEEEYVEPPEDAKLFVGNFPYDMDSEKLAHLFGQAGVVDTAEVIFNRQTDQSRGFGFVTMSTVEEAERAVERFHHYDVGGRLLTVNKAAPKGSRPELTPREFDPSYRVYVGNLPWDVDEARLEQLFSEHCKVVSARVVYDRDTGRSKGFGFVTVSNEAQLNDAIANLDGQSLGGRAIRVNIAAERPRRNSF